MRTYARLFLFSALATVLLDVPFLVWHELPLTDVVIIACMIAVFGVLSSWRYSSRARLVGGFSEEWRVYFSIFPATFALILQAIVAASFSYSDSGTLIPHSPKEKVILLAGLVAFIASLLVPARLIRAGKGDHT
jgi:hypothetical protein